MTTPHESLFDALDEPQPSAPPQPQVLTVSQLSYQIKRVLNQAFDDLIVEGEVSGMTRSAQGHYYFSLKDEKALINCVVWRSVRGTTQHSLQNGQCVRVFGQLNIYEPRSNYQIVVKRVEQAGRGVLQEKFEQMKAQLKSEGLFDPERKRALPFFPHKIAVITSSRGAAVKDFLKILKGRETTLDVRVLSVRVQGVEAPAEIVAALQWAEADHWADTIVLIRGGGSIEDLWAFNEECVARAIAACAIPVITGIGHEVDYTIADFVSDARVPTPTAAAQLLVDIHTEIFDKLETSVQTMMDEVRGRVEYYREKLQSRAEAVRRYHPKAVLDSYRQRIDDLVTILSARSKNQISNTRHHLQALQSRLGYAACSGLETGRHQIARLVDRLNTMNPSATLARGWSLCLKDQGQVIVTSPESLTPDETFEIVMAEGRMNATRTL